MQNSHGNRKRRLLIYFRKGAGEVIAFLVSLPVLMLMLVTIIAVIRAGSLKETMEYTAYKACRAAVASSTYEKAKEAAEDMAMKVLMASGEHVELDTLKVELVYADEQGVSLTRGKSSSVSGYSDDKSKWKKGAFITCMVSVDIKTFGDILSGTKHTKITMMVEKPASQDGEGVYPWFKGL